MNAPLNLHESDLARADAYAVAAYLLHTAPTAELLQWLKASQRNGEGALAEAWNALCAAADTSAEAVASEYDVLFVSIGKPPVSLYASWYLTGFLMEKPLALLRDDLMKLGLARPESQLDPEDSIAAELEVMRHLVLQDHDETGAFFMRHLRPWYADFCAALEAAAQANFYKHLARFLRAFLDVELDYFALQSDRHGGVK